ncbi:helix-turn-helix domain-containing protein [Clostridium brassicae]|uniref:Helix-turn-helix domain-containing protein n=1 Tax=Clostridium brassicae TaxID=2999072 RepID=A0ABT4D9U6_9CLOT|nr:helix-turn-helix domain-containing protein [Clostridium brassicae]MCY6958413.1 helix-turn-helix domain-containing protein [Clostridium brassicae]
MIKKQVDKFGVLLTVEEMAGALGIREEQAYRLICQNAFEVLRVGTIIRVPKVKLVQWSSNHISNYEAK